jgi:hypothetical protein
MPTGERGQKQIVKAFVSREREGNARTEKKTESENQASVCGGPSRN